MAGQRASTPTGDVPEQAQPRTRARAARLPAPRRGADAAPPTRARARAAAGRAAGRSRSGSRTRRPNPGATALAALGLPVVGAFSDELLGSAPGGVFTALTVLGTAAAAWLATRAGWWWVLTGVAPVVLASIAGAELLADRGGYGNAKALATGAAKWAVRGFPVMAAALAAALLVIVLRIVLEQKQKRSRRG
ncbi:hypothetical protein OG455_13795 [Kitasatospora sp. NBC_01287]|uniref:DUF6542 domain-containing protein n=1 Tax=Kitasatospora sp. NBC_01287 TaxID=2903573 RepID=UPI00224CA4CF|nr:DUF6542 domain-containing protein [Kitasatospora sp. NBC_01287]MCX4746582.1 hypothetical protein [Kitasatospora sp. NBC_01287]